MALQQLTSTSDCTTNLTTRGGVLYFHRWSKSTFPHSPSSTFPPDRIDLRALLWVCSQKLSVLLRHWLSNDQNLKGFAVRVFKSLFIELGKQEICHLYTANTEQLRFVREKSVYFKHDHYHYCQGKTNVSRTSSLISRSQTQAVWQDQLSKKRQRLCLRAVQIYF